MDYCKKFSVKPGTKVKLSRIDPNNTAEFKNKKTTLKHLKENKKQLAELQYSLYAENKQSLLVVLQALDAGGKDGTINHVLAPMNPQGCRVQSFKVPNNVELAHDFLWRVHRVTPKNGEVVIFNRSHYEDVLVTRVHKIVSPETCRHRFQIINSFEDLLASNNTKIVKIFLHISKEEQLKRFLKRLNQKEKHWKISEGDYKERQLWDSYVEAFEDVMSNCSKPHAPWYVIPANNKWFRNLAVSQILVETLQKMDMKLPEPTVNIEDIRKLAQDELDMASVSRSESKHENA